MGVILLQWEENRGRDRLHRVRRARSPLVNVTTHGGRVRFGTRAPWGGGAGGRDECGPYLGSLFPTRCNKVTRTLEIRVHVIFLRRRRRGGNPCRRDAFGRSPCNRLMPTLSAGVSVILLR